MTHYVYIKSEPGLWTVGFYDPSGGWHPESDHSTTDLASERVSYLNGQLPIKEGKINFGADIYPQGGG